jgi:cation:H+ antiporter
MEMHALFFTFGIVLLVGGGSLLVTGASRIAVYFKIPSLVIGLTVVAYGTSAPEVAVSVASAFAGKSAMAVGNVVGSNIFNILLILGLSAAITPLVVTRQIVRNEVPILIGVSVTGWLMALNGIIGRWEAAVLLFAAIFYTVVLIVQGRKQNLSSDETSGEEITRWGIVISIGYVLVGLGLLVYGSQLLVDAAVEIARYFAIDEVIIGLTIIAAGTSLPEVATSVVAGLKGERDIAVGNIIGSSTFNILAVLGLSGLVAPVGLPVTDALISFDFPIMILATVACLPIFFTGYRIARWEGLVFLGYYIAYVTYLVLNATEHSLRKDMELVFGYYVIPITLLTLAVLSYRSWQNKRAV